jgi:predicted MFS family arabinose efflux permease
VARPGLLFLLSAAAGLTVANLYYAQPLAAAMAADLGVPAKAIGASLVATQVGYALGMVLLVPLGDSRERRSTIVVTLAASVPALLLVATARSVVVLTASFLAVGVASSVPQMILPFAVDLSAPEMRGRVVGRVMSGLLAGILLSRTASGAVASWLGWRVVFYGAAIAMAILALVLRLALPRHAPSKALRYVALLRSLADVVRSQPVLRRRALVGALGMASFSVFWSMLSFELARQGHGSATAGLFGAVGIAGILAGPVAARRATGSAPARLNAAALVGVALSFVVAWLGATSLVALGAAVVLLDAGAQASHLTNQTVIFGLAPELRSRLNALYMVSYFAGGALGTASAAAAWSVGGWPLVCATGAAFGLLAILPLAGELTRGRTSPRPQGP